MTRYALNSSEFSALPSTGIEKVFSTQIIDVADEQYFFVIAQKTGSGNRIYVSKSQSFGSLYTVSFENIELASGGFNLIPSNPNGKPFKGCMFGTTHFLMFSDYDLFDITLSTTPPTLSIISYPTLDFINPSFFNGLPRINNLHNPTHTGSEVYIFGGIVISGSLTIYYDNCVYKSSGAAFNKVADLTNIWSGIGRTRTEMLKIGNEYFIFGGERGSEGQNVFTYEVEERYIDCVKTTDLINYEIVGDIPFLENLVDYGCFSDGNTAFFVGGYYDVDGVQTVNKSLWTTQDFITFTEGININNDALIRPGIMFANERIKRSVIAGWNTDTTNTTWTNSININFYKDITEFAGLQTDYQTISKNLILSQYEYKDNITGLIEVLASNFSVDFEDYLYRMGFMYDVELSSGENLDRIGRLIGYPRPGLTDYEYQMCLYCYIFSITCSATYPAVYEQLNCYFGKNGQTVGVNKDPLADATAEIQLILPTSFRMYTEMKRLLEIGLPAGVELDGFTVQ